MRTRGLAVLSLVMLSVAGCADNGAAASSGPSAPVSSSGPVSVSGPASASGPASSSKPVTVPSLPVSTASADQTISGIVSAGVEPHCLVLRDNQGSHVLVFHDPSMRTSVPTGAEVTLVGHAEPTMMTTCQQGVPFIVTSVGKK